MRLLPVVIIVLILIPLVNAGEIIHTEISKEDTLVSLNERDVLAFPLKDKDHRLMIKKITEKGVDLTLFVGVDDAKSNEDKNLPAYFTLKAGEEIANLDLDKDRENDITVAILDVTGKKVLLDIKEYEPKIEDITGEVVKDDFDIGDFGLSSIIWTVILLIIIILLLFLVFRKRSTS